VRHAGAQDGTATAYQTIEGEGIAAQVDGAEVYVGNHRLAQRLGWCDDELHQRFEELIGQGHTVVYAGTDDQFLGLHALADVPRPQAAEAVRALHAQGLELTMLTGDNQGTAESVRQAVGLDEVRAELRPEDKLEVIRALREGGVVGMVGDGINDGPALAAANVGIAMGVKGTALALETADVALMTDDLRRLPEVVALGRRALRVIRFNIAFAIAVKVVVLALAVAGLAGLWLAVAADVGASLLVIGHGLTLLRGPKTAAAAVHTGHAHQRHAA
jgi:Cd2+/Zn2+-exporting ATPase